MVYYTCKQEILYILYWEDGAYLVDSIDYIIDYVNDAINGCNPDFEGKLDAELWVV